MRTRLLVAVSTLAIMAGMLAAPSSAAAPPGGGGKKTTTTGVTTTSTTLAPTTTTVAPTTTTTSGTGSFNALCQNVAYVDSTQPTTNFGSTPDMLVSGTTRLSHVGCAVTGIPPGSQATAALHVFSRSPNGDHTLNLHSQPATWVEATVTWNGLHTYDPAVLDAKPGNLVAGAGEWVDLAAGSVVNGEARFTLETATVGGAGLFAYASDDYTTDTSRRPYVTVSYSPAPTTTTLAPTTTTQAPTTTTAPGCDPAPAAQPTGPGGAWTIRFQDEFCGTTVDTGKWTPQDGRANNNVVSEADNVTVAGGVASVFLSQVGSQVYGGFMETAPPDSSGGFELLPGQALEARIYLPGGCPTGATSCAEDIWDWPGLVWSNGYPWPLSGEYDIAEGLGGDLTINYHSCNDTTPSPGCSDVPSNGSPSPACCYGNEWHIATLVRGTTSAQLYLDGVLQRTIPVTDDGGGESIIINIGKSNSRPVHLGAEGAGLVDYVRAWSPA